jgi:hypothetical protein
VRSARPSSARCEDGGVLLRHDKVELGQTNPEADQAKAERIMTEIG